MNQSFHIIREWECFLWGRLYEPSINVMENNAMSNFVIVSINKVLPTNGKLKQPILFFPLTSLQVYQYFQKSHLNHKFEYLLCVTSWSQGPITERLHNFKNIKESMYKANFYFYLTWSNFESLYHIPGKALQRNCNFTPKSKWHREIGLFYSYPTYSCITVTSFLQSIAKTLKM